jgi:hypothetical protein
MNALLEAQARRAAAGNAGPPSGQHIVDIARTRIGEDYVLGARAPLSNEAWHGPWDCAEFASWCVFQVSGIVYGAEPGEDPVLADPYTGYWADDAEELGDIVTVDLARTTVGAMLLRVPSGARGGHIAISDGAGGTIEAHSSSRGVIAHTAGGRRWDYGVLVPGISYSTVAASETEDQAVIWRVTSPMMRGDGIAELQRNLHSLGFDPGQSDGIYGGQTEAAVVDFQAAHGLVADGECGADTRKAIREALPNKE